MIREIGATTRNILVVVGYSVSITHCMTCLTCVRGREARNDMGKRLARKKLNQVGFKSIGVRQVPGDFLQQFTAY